MKVDAQLGQCIVLTYKEGMLARVGHDLKLRCESFEVLIGEDGIQAEFNADRFSVVAAMKDGREQPGQLSDKDQKQILENIRKEVLHSDRFPVVRFSSTQVQRGEREWTVAGTLEMHGVSKPLTVSARRVGGDLIAEVEIHTPDYGISPFSALLGTLKVKPGIKVRLTIPAPCQPPRDP